MKLYKELSDAMSEIISTTKESTDFKARFLKLIENYFDNSYTERDINDVIELVDLTAEENVDGN